MFNKKIVSFDKSGIHKHRNLQKFEIATILFHNLFTFLKFYLRCGSINVKIGVSLNSIFLQKIK